MSKDLAVTLGLSIIGFLVLIVGSLGYMKVYALNETASVVLMGIGIVMIIAALAVMSLKKGIFVHAAEEE